LFGMGW